jgi:hypothetical protein
MRINWDFKFYKALAAFCFGTLQVSRDSHEILSEILGGFDVMSLEGSCLKFVGVVGRLK